MRIDGVALYRLMVWLSPSFPVGAFSYSHGLEWLIECGAVKDEPSLKAWIRDVLRHGAGRSDGILFAHAYRAAEDIAALKEIAELAAALAPSAERHLETTAQGTAFCETLQQAWPVSMLTSLQAEWDGPVAYPVAVALAAAGHGIPLEAALTAYLHAMAANLVSAGLRLVPLGQTAGQRILAGIEETIAALACEAPALPLEEIGGALLLTDMASMRHETQYTRLFRS